MLAHDAAFACAKPVYFSCALSRTSGLAARIGRAQSAFGGWSVSETLESRFLRQLDGSNWQTFLLR